MRLGSDGMGGGEAVIITSTGRGPLPSYTDPPVQHVSFALLLDPVPLKSVHLGLLWTEMLRKKYPDAADMAPTINQMEQFVDEHAMPQFQFQIMQGAPAPQVVFSSPENRVSFGVQNDRLTHLWEAKSPKDKYPRYPSLRGSFENDVSSFASFSETHKVGHVALRQIEVQYINVLTRGEGWERPGELHRVLRPWSPDFSADLGEPEDVRIAQRYLVRREDGDPYARLHIAVEPHRAVDGATTMRMALTFRGTPEAFSLEGILALVDDGHDRIVRAFTAATTPEMHQVWGREQ